MEETKKFEQSELIEHADIVGFMKGQRMGHIYRMDPLRNVNRITGWKPEIWINQGRDGRTVWKAI